MSNSMTIRRPILLLGSALLAASSVLMGGYAQSASAACPEANDTAYNTEVKSKNVHLSAPKSRVWGSGGGTLSIGKDKSWSVSGSVTGTTSAEAGAIFAKASASVGVTVGAERTVTTTSSYTWKVPSTQSRGWLEAGSNGVKVSYKKGYITRDTCEFKTQKTGTITGATSQISYNHS